MGEQLIRVGVGFEASKIIGQYRAEARQVFFAAMDDLGKVGVEEMQKKIERTSSKSSRSGLKALLGFNAGGRIRTGDMYRSVAYRPRGRGKLYQVEVGYLRNFKDYFKYQETGFTQVWKYLFPWAKATGATAPNAPAGHLFKKVAPTKVAGIFAMRDARDKMNEAIEPIIRRAARRMDKM